MINRTYGKIELTCDACELDSIAPVDAEDFDILVDNARNANWKLCKEKGQWKHYCPDCQRQPISRRSLL